MGVDILRIESNERVDIADFDFISESIQAHERQLYDNFFCDVSRTRKWIISGFAISNPAAKQLQVTKGKAILGARIDGVTQYGMLSTEGDAALTVDLNSYSPGTYGVYIRFERIDGESQSRIFWNPSGAGSEYAQAINTRYTASWSLRVEASSPGDDWLKIGEVDQATMAITDQREFFFEGAVDDYYESGWSTDGGGNANDRNSNRATYGITNLQMFTAAMRECLRDIKGRGLREWYERDIGGLNIGFDANPTEGRLALGDSNFYLTLAAGDCHINWDPSDSFRYYRSANVLGLILGGTLLYQWDSSAFFTDQSIDLGKSGNPWPNVYGTIFLPGQNDGDGIQGNLLPTANDTYDLGNTNRKWQDLYLSGDARIDNTLIFDTGAGNGMGSNLLPATDSTHQLGDSANGLGSGTDRRFSKLFLDEGWQTELTNEGPIGVFYNDSGPTNEKWWQFYLDNGGGFQIKALDDAYSNPETLISMRNGASINPTVEISAEVWCERDSGSTPYSPALRLYGTHPCIQWDDNDTNIHADHRDWLVRSRWLTGDVGRLDFMVASADGTSTRSWLDVVTAAGANTRVDEIYLMADEEIILSADGGTSKIVSISASGGSGPSSVNYLGLTSDWYAGSAGVDYTIKGVSGSTNRTSTGFLKIFTGTGIRYVPFFDYYSG